MQTRTRELEASIERARKEVQEGKERRKYLHHERQILKHRLDARQMLIVLTTSAPLPARSPLQEVYLAESEIQTDPSALKVDIQPPAQPRQYSDLSEQAQNTSHHQLVQAQRHSRYNQHCAAPSLGPISAFNHHAVVSFAAISKYVTSPNLQSPSRFNHRDLRQAFLMFQTETAQRMDIPASEICWFIEWPYEPCAQLPLCTCFSAWSGASMLSSMVARILFTLESLFLVMEHEHLSSAADPFFEPPKHPALDAPAPLPPRPQPPDAAALAAASVLCSVTELVQMEVALRKILPPLVRHFRGALPYGKWLTVCIQIMRVSQTAADAMRSMPNQPPQANRTAAAEARADQDTQSRCEVQCSMSCMGNLPSIALLLDIMC
jgi:hypothetical protein